ncbi:MAG: hypothetical protein ACK46Q_15750 [Hyphomonas sp.]
MFNGEVPIQGQSKDGAAELKMSDKRSDFLWIVQMIMLRYEAKIVGWSGIAGDAVAASYKIPRDMSARDAALGFCAAMVEGFSGAERDPAPSWMIALKDPI